MANTNTTTTTTNNATLASRAAGLLTKTAALGVVEKALDQALAAKRVFPPLAADYAEQLGYEFPLKTKDFVRVVGHLLQASEKPLKGIVSKRKSEILAVLAEIVGALTDTQPVALPDWAMPKSKAKATEAEAEATEETKAAGALDKANVLAEAEANAAKAEANADAKLASAVALVVSRATELSADQRAMLLAVLATEAIAEATEAIAEAEAEESAEA